MTPRLETHLETETWDSHEWQCLKDFTKTKPPVREANLYEFAGVAIVGIDTTNSTHR